LATLMLKTRVVQQIKRREGRNRRPCLLDRDLEIGIPAIVDNSAIPFIKPPKGFGPLNGGRGIEIMKAVIAVAIVPSLRPYSKVSTAKGIPVGSNVSLGIRGKGISKGKNSHMMDIAAIKEVMAIRSESRLVIDHPQRGHSGLTGHIMATEAI